MRLTTRLIFVFTGAVLFATACGGGGETDIAVATPVDSGTDDASTSAATAAERNIGLLQSSDDVRLIEVLDVADGSITTLDGAIDGDRPVLLWFWAPH